jgi:hypothetical protein
MIKGDAGLGAHATGVNQINNAFGYVDVDQSHKVYVKKFNLDVDIYKSFNKSYESKRTYESSYTSKKYVDVNMDVYKKSIYVRK